MKDNGVTVVCYGKTEHWNSRQEAINYYFEGMLSCEGSEQDRYTKIYSELISGCKVCTD